MTFIHTHPRQRSRRPLTSTAAALFLAPAALAGCVRGPLVAPSQQVLLVDPEPRAPRLLRPASESASEGSPSLHSLAETRRCTVRWFRNAVASGAPISLGMTASKETMEAQIPWILAATTVKWDIIADHAAARALT